jgi:UDP-N-acetylglucosamine--N-acetylmuramyl-(pentapeptide) pyrophosphoryl-undecaprenol N-acetylglucosamine transferase
MTVYLLAGGGTAGHVNPLLATADAIRAREPGATVLVLGTAEGLESRLVPERGYELLTIERVPFPRRLTLSTLAFPARFMRAVRRVTSFIAARKVDIVVGFGGYAAAPAYLAARRAGIPLVIHEANALPGIANKWGSRLTRHVAVTFPDTPLAHAHRTGMPLRAEIANLDRVARRAEALRHFGLDTTRPVLVVTGGSTGAARINATITKTARDIATSGWQILHTVGETREFVDPKIAGYHALPYCDRMDLALAAADFVVARSGAATVSELAGLGIPSVFVPYPVGNGEQELNARDLVGAGGAILCRDSEFTGEWVRNSLIPLLANGEQRRIMGTRASASGIRDGAERLTDMVFNAVSESRA